MPSDKIQELAARKQALQAARPAVEQQQKARETSGASSEGKKTEKEGENPVTDVVDAIFKVVAAALNLVANILNTVAQGFDKVMEGASKQVTEEIETGSLGSVSAIDDEIAKIEKEIQAELEKERNPEKKAENEGFLGKLAENAQAIGGALGSAFNKLFAPKEKEQQAEVAPQATQENQQGQQGLERDEAGFLKGGFEAINAALAEVFKGTETSPEASANVGGARGQEDMQREYLENGNQPGVLADGKTLFLGNTGESSSDGDDLDNPQAQYLNAAAKEAAKAAVNNATTSSNSEPVTSGKPPKENSGQTI